MDVNIIGATTLIVKDLVNLNPQEENIRYICQHSSKAFTDLGLNESDITAIENDMLERLDIWKDRYPERYGEKMGDDVYYVVTDGMVELIRNISAEDVIRLPAPDFNIVDGKVVYKEDQMPYKVLALEHAFRCNFAPYVISAEDITDINSELQNIITEVNPEERIVWVYVRRAK